MLLIPYLVQAEGYFREAALGPRLRHPAAMAGQLRHLLALADSPHATVRIIPKDALFYESRGHNFDVLSFAGTTDRIGVCYYRFSAPNSPRPTCTTSGPA
jgi:Domain of unknown function (DUF5753)